MVRSGSFSLFKMFGWALLPAALLVLTTGCGTATVGSSAVEIPAGQQGVVHGGQQGISGATIQLYAVGTGGGPAVPLLNPAPKTLSDGSFNLNGSYMCPSPAALTYVVATGGNPGLANGLTNPNGSLMAALGACGSLPSTYVVINELTTVAAVYALAPYFTANGVGSSTANAPALAAAFALSQELVNTSTGAAPGVGVPVGMVVPTAQINLLGNILAACINTGGGYAGDSGTGCGKLFSLVTPTTVPATAPPTDTISALVMLADNPTIHTAGLYVLPAPGSPFGPTPSTQPPDLSVQLATAPPTISPTAGTYASPLSVSITALGGAAIYYTTDSTLPTTASTRYTAPFSLSASATVNAITVMSGSTNGSASAAYTLQTPANLQLSPSAGLTFPATNIGIATAPMTLSLQNLGAASTTASISITGTNAGEFSQTNNCTGSITSVPCSIQVTATPGGSGTRSANLSVAYTGVNSPLSVPLSVTGLAGVGSLSTTALAFYQPGDIGTTTLTNTGNGVLTIGSIALSSTNWTQLNNCGSSLAPGASCIVAVTASANTGQFTGTLTVTDSDTADSQVVQLTSDVRILYSVRNSTSYDLGGVAVGQISLGVFTINGGIVSGSPQGYTYSITSFDGANPSDFSHDNLTTCLTSGPACFISYLDFEPHGAGYRSDYITTNALETIYEHGYGLTTSPSFVFTPGAEVFTNVAVGTTATATLTVTNTSTNALAFPSIGTLTTGGSNNSDFSVSGQTCSAGLPAPVAKLPTPGLNLSTCTYTISFTPTTVGQRSTVLTLTDSTGATAKVLIVSQGAVAPLPFTAPSVLDLGRVQAGSTSAPQVLTVTVPSQDAITATIKSGASSLFNVAGTTGCSKGASICQFSLTVSPTVSGPLLDNLILTDSATGYTFTTELRATGVGIVATPVITPGTGSYVGSTLVTIGTTTPGSTIIYTTNGMTAAPGGPIYTGPFTVSSTTTVQAIATNIGYANSGVTSAVLTFYPAPGTPTFLPGGGSYSSTQMVTISSTAGTTIYYTTNGTMPTTASAVYTGPVAVAASETLQAIAVVGGTSSAVGSAAYAIGGPPVAMLSASSLTFTQFGVAQNVTLTNTGYSTLSISGISFTGSVSGAFSETDNCGTALLAQSICTIAVSGTTAAGFSASGTMTISDNAASSPQTVGLSYSNAVETSNPTTSFGEWAVGASSTVGGTSGTVGSVQLFYQTNLGPSGYATLSGSNPSDFQIVQVGNSPASACTPSYHSCQFYIQFHPSGLGLRTAAFNIQGIGVLQLSGTGDAGPVDFSFSYSSALTPVTAYPFSGTVRSSTSFALTITNTGTAPLSLNAPVLSGANAGEFTASQSCGTVAVGTTCGLSLQFVPTQVGPASATVTLTDSTGAVQRSVQLTGTAYATPPVLTPSALNFPETQYGAVSAGQVVMVTAYNNDPVTFTATPPSPLQFSPQSCAQTPCNVTITFAPTTTNSGRGPYYFYATDTTAYGSTSSPLSATGIAGFPVVSLSSSSLTFANRTIGSTSIAQMVTLTNTGNTGLTLNGISLTGANPGDYVLTNGCAAYNTLAVNANCTFTVSFDPTTSGLRTANIQVLSNATSSPDLVSLSGMGQ